MQRYSWETRKRVFRKNLFGRVARSLRSLMRDADNCRMIAAEPLPERHCPSMARRCSNDLRARVPILFFEQGYKVPQISTILGIKKSLIYAIVTATHGISARRAMIG
ncbi:hypothetical protein CYLTODRAFT_124277 [Cylindrobasidium torrendii FP15055 ss-10]|uniref:Uncharacterized protein n=1 Tax=Cylindrobasidium torrendii FP15055 ss-10 TaxID=1314674 RepID=A0A0D7BMU2_9AGAR|nr:hypothetical protein CYLTODRAFT_124277 [Cylindrobasidium torrendii FP15055 ss-10]